METTALAERGSFAVVLMKLEMAKGHKWRRNSQGLIMLGAPPEEETHHVACIGATCTRCGRWFCMQCEAESVTGCPPRVYVS
jgi:hypothetical protein